MLSSDCGSCVRLIGRGRYLVVTQDTVKRLYADSLGHMLVAMIVQSINKDAGRKRGEGHVELSNDSCLRLEDFSGGRM
jgi:hypothetical protein